MHFYETCDDMVVTCESEKAVTDLSARESRNGCHHLYIANGAGIHGKRALNSYRQTLNSLLFPIGENAKKSFYSSHCNHLMFLLDGPIEEKESTNISGSHF